MIIQVIRSPEDLERTLRKVDRFRLGRWILPLSDCPQGPVDEAVRGLFGRRHLIRKGPEVAAAWRESAGEQLTRLRALGVQIVALCRTLRRPAAVPAASRGTRPPSLTLADYLVAHDPCYFRRERGDHAGLVHRLGAGCRAGHGEIIGGAASGREKTFAIWASRDYLLFDFERAVPWCQTCLGEDLVAGLMA